MMKFTWPDIVVFLIYCAIVIMVGIIVSRRVNRKKDANSYFFAGNSLPWYIIGSSVIAANISAEQFIGMSGSGFAMGITIASYEWLAAIMLIMVALWFLPVFIQEYTGLISPGITAVFVLGIFWIRTTAKAAWIAVLITLPVPLLLKYFFPALPFLDNMLASFLIISVQMIFVTLLDKRLSPEMQKWELPSGIFRMNDPVFKWFAAGIVVIIGLLYSYFW